MNTKELITELSFQYDNFNERASFYFQKWIETGESIYKENELMHIGAAYALLKIKNVLEKN